MEKQGETKREEKVSLVISWNKCLSQDIQRVGAFTDILYTVHFVITG